MRIQYTLHIDGSFDLALGAIKLRQVFPGLNDASLRPVSIRVDEDSINYQLAEGELVLRFHAEDPAHLIIQTRFNGLSTAPHSFAPLFDARIDGAASFYHQGLGFGGPSGVSSLTPPRGTAERPLNRLSFDDAFADLTSYVTSGLIADGGQALIFGALDHRDFEQKTMVRRRDHSMGLSNRRMSRSLFLAEISFATECIPVSASGFQLPDLHFYAASDAYAGLEKLARSIGRTMQCRGALIRGEQAQAPTYHYCSWYDLAASFGMSHLSDLLEGLATLPEKLRLDTIQIDASYFPHVGDWLEPCPQYPKTFKEAAALIQQHGYAPGVWIAPFMVGSHSRIAREHPDWILRDREGRPMERWKDYGPSREWNASDDAVLSLDTSHPEAFAYLPQVFRTFRSRGIRFYKSDFMDWGLYDSSTVQRYTPGRTGQQYIRDVMAMIREEIGEDSYWLGCILPFNAGLGFVDGMRIGNDLHPKWSSGGVGNMIQEALCDQFFNQVWWQNDPDVLYLREHTTHFNREENQFLALFAAMTGGSVNTSDALHRLSPEGRALWHFIEPSNRHFVGEVAHWEQQVHTRQGAVLKSLVKRGESGAVGLLLLNPGETVLERCIELRVWTGLDSAVVHTWGPGGSSAVEDGRQIERFFTTIPERSVRLYYVSASGEAPPPRLKDLR